MPRLLFLFLSAFILVQGAKADDFQFGQHDDALAWKNYSKDTTANAVVLKEFGSSTIIGHDNKPLSVYYHVRTKIFNKDGFDEGNVVIALYSSDANTIETVRDIKAVTMVRMPDGTVKTTELDKSNIFRENINKYLDHIKFAMPNMQEGCVIEYSYVIESPFIYSLKPWEFQTDIPKVQSVYRVQIPAIITYNGVLIGDKKLYGTESKIEKDCMHSAAFSNIDCSVLAYEMRDIPAFIEEDYMTSPKNFKSAIRFELSEYYDYNGGKHVVTKEWENVDESLMSSEYFGKQIKRKGLFKDMLATVTKEGDDDLAKAKAIYSHYQNWFRWNGIYSHSSDNIAKAIKEHTGNVGDINLTLIAALTAAGINTDAVLLSTRENGLVNKLYPGEADFNYVIAKVNIGTDSFFLDATDPMLPFGMLPKRCINDQGRVVHAKEASYWVDMKATHKSFKMYDVALTLENDGNLTGTLTLYTSGYEGYEKRRQIKSSNSFQEYAEGIDQKDSKLKILDATVDELDNRDETLKETYKISLNAFDSIGSVNTLLLNPYVFFSVKENPFKLESRSFPVDIGVPSEVRYMFSCKLPEGYQMEESADEVKIALPNGGGMFISETTNAPGTVNVSQVLKFQKSVYNTAEYPYLKEFYNKVIQTHKTDLVFKKS